MIVRKDITPACIYCKYGEALPNDMVMCNRHGVLNANDSCKSFKYDPLKRTPSLPVRAKKVSEVDAFKL